MKTLEKTMLYLTDLPYGINIIDIQGFLSNYKESIVKIMPPEMYQRNVFRGKALAIKVLFKDNESADKCRKEMNLRKLWGKSVRIMWEEMDTSLRYNTKSNLYIKGIPKTTTPREVYEYFMQFGDIFSCKVSENETGMHNGYGYITFYRSEDAEKAIQESKGKKIFGVDNVEISHFQKKNERMINTTENNNHKIFINNLPEKYSVSELNDLCKDYGKIENCNMYLDKIGKNFGIVEFSNEAEAKDAMAKLDGKEIEKNKINVQLYQTQFEHKQFLMNKSLRIREQKDKCNLIIKNIPLTSKEEDLEKTFKKYGEITSIRIEKNKIEKKDEKGKFELVSKGFGYISFDKPEDAKKAIEEMDQKFLPGFEGWNKPLEIDYFLTKNERQFVENHDMNIQNYLMPPNQNTPFMVNIPPHQYPPAPFPQGMYPPMAPHMPMPMRFPMIQFNHYNNYGYYNNNNNFYNRRGGKKYNNNYKGNKRNNYRYNNNNNNKYRKDKEKEDEEYNNININIENKIDFNEYEKLDNDEERKNFFGEKVFSIIEESQLAIDKKLTTEDIARITGMIIEIPYKEIIETLQNPLLFKKRIAEALMLLQK
jgi:polyadenylate-binding protein